MDGLQEEALIAHAELIAYDGNNVNKKIYKKASFPCNPKAASVHFKDLAQYFRHSTGLYGHFVNAKNGWVEDLDSGILIALPSFNINLIHAAT
jgi:hypothetical protein